MSLKVKKREKGKYEVIELVGNASSDEVFKLSKAMEDARSRGAKHIAIDVSKALFMDSSSLGVLILNLKIVKKDKGSLCILNPTPYILELLHNSNLDTVFRIVNSEDKL